MTNNRLELHRENYYFEMDRKDKLGSNVTLPSGISTLIFGAIAYFVNQIDTLKNTFPKAIFILTVIATIVSLITTVIFLIVSYFGYKYKYIPTSREIEKHWTDLEQYYKDYPDAEGNLEENFYSFLIKRYSECNDRNAFNNDTKSSYLHKANTWLIVALICSAIAMVPLHYGKVISWYGVIKSAFSTSQEVMKNESRRSELKTSTTTSTPTTSKRN